MSKSTLLIVEDNLAQQVVYKQLCEKFDCLVVFCSTGEDAIKAIKLEKYSAILLDYRLPGMIGVEVAQQIRYLEAGQSERTPLIALTAHLSEETERQFRAAGVDDFMTKPFAIDEFRKLLLRQLYQSHEPNLKLLNKTSDGSDIIQAL